MVRLRVRVSGKIKTSVYRSRNVGGRLRVRVVGWIKIVLAGVGLYYNL